MPEEQLIKKFWPDENQPTTQSPSMFYKNGEVQIYSDTFGANSAFQIISLQEVISDRWQVYTGSFKLESADHLVAVAHRIGYLPSPQVAFIQN